MTRPAPLTAEEMRAMYRAGDSVSQIASKARLRNGLGKEQVRAVLFGEGR